MPLQSYRELRVWREGIELAKAVYPLTRLLPDDERFGLASQLKRGSVAVPSLIAEGYARWSTREYRRYVSMARSAIAEIETQLILCYELDLAPKTEVEPVLAYAEGIGAKLNRLATSLISRERRPTPDPPLPTPTPPATSPRTAP